MKHFEILLERHIKYSGPTEPSEGDEWMENGIKNVKENGYLYATDVC